ncbi:copia protein [Tanacetum coccineum]
MFICKTTKDVWNSLIITHQGNKQVKDNKIDLFVQKYEEFMISDDETIDCAFARFNTIITSLKALDESFSSRNHVRKFLRALPTKWRPKVTAIEESNDLSTLPLEELIGNLKVYEVVLKKDSKASKVKKEKYNTLALKARKVSSDEEESCSGSDEEYAMAEEKKGKEDRRCFKCGNPNHFISDCPKHSFNDQKAFVGGCWSESDEEDESKRDEVCLMALDNNEVRLKVKLELDDWIKDSGCSRHMTGNKDLFSTYEAINGGNVVFGSNTKSKIIGKGLWYPKGTDVETIVYTYSDHEGDYVDRKSTSGVCTFMGCCLTSWFSKKQTTLAISTTEAKYVFAKKSCQQDLWMKQALVDYDIKLDDIPIFCDNKGAIDLSKNPVFHSRTKHIEIRHHFLRDNVQKGNISIEKVSSEAT